MPKHVIIEDPDFEGWDGKWLDISASAPANLYDYALVGEYMRQTKKEFKDLSPEEIELFRIKK